MSETGFTEFGYFRRTAKQIYDDYKLSASGVLEEINLGPGSFGYQLSQVIMLREREMELLVESMVSGMSVELAYGDFLRKHGVEKRIELKGPQKAGGYVHLTFDCKAPADTPVNLKGTYYTTPEGKKYYRSETGAGKVINSYIGISRSVRPFDGLPSPFNSIAGTGYCCSTYNGTGGTNYDPIFNNESQIIDWRDATVHPTTGSIYYIGISGFEITIKDDVSAETEGTGGNVGINSVITWHNNITLPTITTVNNPADITGGADWESDDVYRKRISDASNRDFTYDAVRSVGEGINGVRALHVTQALGTDRISISGSWNAEGTGMDGGVRIKYNYSGAEDSGNFVSGNQYNQKFDCGEGVMSLKKIVFRGRRIGIPPPMIVALRNANSSTYEESGVFDTYDVNPPASTWQDINVNFDYLDLDPTETYVVDFWCADKSGASGLGYWNAHYWEIATGDVQSGNLGDGDSYTGLLLSGDDVVSTGVNLLFKTYYGANSVKINVAIKDGYNYSEIETELDTKLDWVSGGGNMPMGINYSINQAIPVYMYYSVTAYLEDNTNLTVVQDNIDKNVENYVENLDPGTNIIYSQIYKIIMNESEVWRIDDLELWESGGIHSTGQDIYIGDKEVGMFGGSTLNQG